MGASRDLSGRGTAGGIKMIHRHGSARGSLGEWFSTAAFLLLLAVLLLIPGNISAATITTAEGFKLSPGSRRDSSGKVTEEWYVLQCNDYRGTGSELTIPSEYEGIPINMVSGFNNIPSLKKVVIPEGVKTVSGFTGCQNLETVELPDSLEKLGNVSSFTTGEVSAAGSFTGCPKLANVKASFKNLQPGTVTEKLPFEGTPWYNNYKKTHDPVIFGSVLVDFTKGELVVPEGVTGFRNYMILENNDRLVSLHLPKSFTGSIGNINGKNFKKVTAAGNSIYSVKDNVLYRMRDGKKDLLAYPTGKTDRQFTVPADVDYIYYMSENPYLEEVSFAGNSIMINGGAFDNCTGLTDIRFPETVTIGGGAFANTAIEELELPAGFDCPYYGSSGYFAFIDMPNLTAVKVAAGNTGYKDIDGVLFSKDGEKLLTYPGGRKDTFYNVPDGVKDVWCGFTSCQNLTAIYVPKSVKTILGHFKKDMEQTNDYSIPNCPKLAEIYYEGSSADWADVSAAVKGLKLTCNADPMKPVSALKVKGIPKTAEYTGKRIRPAVSVYNGSKKLVNKVDYTVSYGKNKQTGTASVVIAGKGIYRDSAEKSFVIVPKAVRGLKLTGGKKQIRVTYKKAAGASGYEVTWSLRQKSGYAKKPIAGKKTSAVIKKLKSKKTYYVKVRPYKTVGKKKYYGKYTKPVKVKTK